MRTKEDIIRYARELRCEYNTRDPYILARHYGIRVGDDLKLGISKKAYTIKMDNYPTTIMINNVYHMRSKIVLCAHELGHALLHDSGISNFAITEKNAFTNDEYEANLFAVSLLFDDKDFNIPITQMSNYILKSILDYNIALKEV